jgi:TetR/AcrR family transcriptional regulator, tetracycline repressor protein
VPPDQQRSTLTLERIVGAAFDLIDRGGLEGLSMRKLGTALGVEAMALYHHVRSKERLLAAVAERLDREIADTLDTSGDWLAALRQMARACRAVARQHPTAIALLAQREADAKIYLYVVNDRLHAAGFDPVLTALILHVVDCYAMGAALAESVRAQGGTEAPGAADEIFETGLALVIDRIRALPTQVSARSTRR